MKIEQEKSFKPITIVLETARDVDLFWHIMSHHELNFPLQSKSAQMARILSNWLSSEAQIGP